MSNETFTTARITPTARIGDADRDLAVEQLAAHYAEGRLTHAEFDQRSATALAARTHGEIAALLVDLPAGTGTAPLPQGTTPSLPAPQDAGAAAALEVWREEVLHNWMVFCLVAVVSMAMTSQPWMLIPMAAWGLRVFSDRARARRDPRGYLASRGACRRSRRADRRRAHA